MKGDKMITLLDNKQPLVSLITVTYNSEKTIERTIKSVLNQTYSNIEYIIVDGKSNDRTLEIINKYKSYFQNKLILISEKDNGIYDAMNKGIKHANGEIIGIINSDDWYEVNAVEKVVQSVLNNNVEGVYHGYLRFVSDSGEEILVSRSSATNLRNKMIEHPACFVTKNIYKTHGLFNLEYKYCADYDFMLRLYEKNVQFIKVEAIIANFTIGGISSTPKAALETLKMKRDRAIISNKQYLLKKLQMQITFTLKRIFSYS
jgi:glycosyltransferase involved in cell wall biosynthesis